MNSISDIFPCRICENAGHIGRAEIISQFILRSMLRNQAKIDPFYILIYLQPIEFCERLWALKVKEAAAREQQNIADRISKVSSVVHMIKNHISAEALQLIIYDMQAERQLKYIEIEADRILGLGLCQRSPASRP